MQKHAVVLLHLIWNYKCMILFNVFQVLQEKLLRREALVQLRDQMNDQVYLFIILYIFVEITIALVEKILLLCH